METDGRQAELGVPSGVDPLRAYCTYQTEVTLSVPETPGEEKKAEGPHLRGLSLERWVLLGEPNKGGARRRPGLPRD